MGYIADCYILLNSASKLTHASDKIDLCLQLKPVTGILCLLSILILYNIYVMQNINSYCNKKEQNVTAIMIMPGHMSYSNMHHIPFANIVPGDKSRMRYGINNQ